MFFLCCGALLAGLAALHHVRVTCIKPPQSLPLTLHPCVRERYGVRLTRSSSAAVIPTSTATAWGDSRG